jgi:PAS domain-containing protein
LGLLALGAIHIAFSTLGRPTRAGQRRPLLTALHIAGVIVVGFIWMHAGGLQNPAFLTVFALPVVGAIFISRWQPYLMAIIAITIAVAVALAQAPELRWYVPGLNTAATWLATLLNQQAITASVPFQGFIAPSGYFLVMLEVFAIVIVACAIAAEYLGTIIDRLNTHVETARDAAERGEELWATLIEDMPLPVLLVDIDTLQIVCASKPAAAFATTEPEDGANLFDTVRFSYPDAVQELIMQGCGVIALSMIQVGNKLCATEVRVQPMAQKNRRFALVAIEDHTEAFTIRAALDATGQAALVIDSRGQLLEFNRPARILFADIAKYMDAALLLSLDRMPARWWEPGITGRRKMHLEIAPRVYEVTSSVSPLPGEEERLYIVTFLPVARSAIGDHTAITATARIADASSSTLTSTLVTPP